MYKVINVTQATFDTEVMESPVPVLVDFYAVRCGPCGALAPILAGLAAEYVGRIKVVTVDAGAEQELTAQYEVTALPTVLIISGGRVTAKLVGLQTKSRLLSALGLN
jgi:thioredoxin 1